MTTLLCFQTVPFLEPKGASGFCLSLLSSYHVTLGLSFSDPCLFAVPRIEGWRVSSHGSEQHGALSALWKLTTECSNEEPRLLP